MTFAPLKLSGLALILGLAAPAYADPALGVGVSFAFGKGAGVDVGIGARVFSDDEEDSTVGSIGLDYMFGSKRVRPTIGIARLGDDNYIGLDMGFGPGGSIDFGLSGGYVDTESSAPAIEPPPQEPYDLGPV